MSYGLSFAAISSLVVYTYLHNRKQIWRQYRNSTTEKPDIHMKLMQKYKEAPTIWYMSLFAIVSRQVQLYHVRPSNIVTRCSYWDSLQFSPIPPISRGGRFFSP